MRTPTRSSRTLGALLILQMAGLIVPFILLRPIAGPSSELLLSAIGSETQLKFAIVLLFVNTALTLGLSIWAWPVFRVYSERLALWLIAVGVIVVVFQMIDNGQILTMISLSKSYTEAGLGADGVQGLASLIGATRRWVHYSELIAVDWWIFMLYVLFYRSGLVPKWLAGLGLLTVALHFVGVPMMAFIGFGLIVPMAFWMALSHLILGGFLIIRGFPEKGV